MSMLQVSFKIVNFYCNVSNQTVELHSTYIFHTMEVNGVNQLFGYPTLVPIVYILHS